MERKSTLSRIDRPDAISVDNSVYVESSVRSQQDDDDDDEDKTSSGEEAQYNPTNPFNNVTFGFKMVPPYEIDYIDFSNDPHALNQKMSIISDTENGSDHELYDIDSVGDIDSD